MLVHEVFRDTEWQANAFASALLMPARGLLALEQKYDGLSPVIASENFRVSAQAASYRLDMYNARKQQSALVVIPQTGHVRPAFSLR